MENERAIKENWEAGPVEALLSAFFTALPLYLLFFTASKFIWAQNVNLPLLSINPWVRPLLLERDGIESYVLYFMLLLTMALSFASFYGFSRITSPVLKKIFFAAAVIYAGAYALIVGFDLPMSEFSKMRGPNFADVAVYMGALSAVAAVFILEKKKPAVLYAAISAVLIPACFIAHMKFQLFDYNFVLGPALRLAGGASLNDIYFLYDMLLPALAAMWIRLNINVGYFQVFTQLTFYLFFIGVYFFAAKLFRKKALAHLFIISAVLIRLYANMADADSFVQLTPLRLDLWLIPLFASFYAGPFSVLTAVSAGVLLVLSQTFGFIYAAAYAQLLAVLLIIDFSAARAKKAALNWGILLVFYAASALIFKREGLDTALVFQRVGIGFLPITAGSFYWYFPAFCGAVFSMLLSMRKKLDEKYFSSSMFILLLAAGNLMYFFGRSHPNNLLNVSTLILLTLYLFIDLAAVRYPKAVYILPALLMAAAVSAYSGRIAAKVKVQASQLMRGRINSGAIAYPDVSFIKREAGAGGKIYIASLDNQVLWTLSGGIRPVGYYFPMNTCVMKDEMTLFLQKLLDNGYCIAADAGIPDETIAALKYGSMTKKEGIRFLRGTGP
jgi:hypothetical protein